MNFWTVLQFLSCITYFSLAVYVLSKNYKSALNITAAGLFLCFSMWGLGNTLLYNRFINVEAAAFLLKIESTGWLFFGAFLLMFFYVFTGRKKVFRNPLFYAVLFLPPLIIYYQLLKGNVLDCCTQLPYGLTSEWKDTVWVYFFYVYYVVMVMGSMVVLAETYFKSADKIKKNISMLLLVTVAVCFVGGTVLSVLLKEMKIHLQIEGPAILLIFAFAIIYAMAKYEFMAITPSKAAGSIINTMKDCLMILDSRGFPVTVNKCVYETLNVNEKEFIIKFMKNELFDEKIISRVALGEEIEDKEITISAGKGKEKTFLFSSSPLVDGKSLIGSVCIFKDITDRKENEKALKKTVAELRRSNEELERFAYVASHDLKEPLRMVSSYVQLIEKKYSGLLGKDGEEYIKFAAGGAAKMAALLDGLLDYSRVRRKGGEFSECDTGKVLFYVTNMMKFRLEDTGASVKIKGSMPVVFGDEMQVRSLFQNLLDNALKFRGKAAPEITVSSVKEGDMFVFSVSDNGIGIETRHFNRIFEIFQRLHGDDNYEGTGIGLALCKKIVERHSGHIWVESGGAGRGAVFYFTLPSAAAKD